MNPTQLTRDFQTFCGVEGLESRLCMSVTVHSAAALPRPVVRTGVRVQPVLTARQVRLQRQRALRLQRQLRARFLGTGGMNINSAVGTTGLSQAGTGTGLGNRTGVGIGGVAAPVSGVPAPRSGVAAPVSGVPAPFPGIGAPTSGVGLAGTGMGGGIFTGAGTGVGVGAGGTVGMFSTRAIR